MTRLFEDKPYIVAEIGSNWETLEHCLHSIQAAKDCGASAAKFQLFDHQALYGEPAPGVWKKGEPLKGVLPQAWLPHLADHAKAARIELMCTAFSPELVAVVDPFVSVHKVASSDAAWPQMLEAVAKTGKPVLVSYGAKKTSEMEASLRTLMPPGPTREDIVPLHCVAAYPADYQELGSVGFDGVWGLSDHTLGYSVPVEAARRGAIVIEKHFTAFPDLDTPDRPHSLTPKQFKRMVDIIRGREVESEEQAMFLRHNRRLLAIKDIAPGQILRYGIEFGSYRSLEDDTRGASPFDWEKVNGRMAKGEIKRGKAISLEDVE